MNFVIPWGFRTPANKKQGVDFFGKHLNPLLPLCFCGSLISVVGWKQTTDFWCCRPGFSSFLYDPWFFWGKFGFGRHYRGRGQPTACFPGSSRNLSGSRKLESLGSVKKTTPKASPGQSLATQATKRLTRRLSGNYIWWKFRGGGEQPAWSLSVTRDTKRGLQHRYRATSFSVDFKGRGPTNHIHWRKFVFSQILPVFVFHELDAHNYASDCYLSCFQPSQQTNGASTVLSPGTSCLKFYCP